MASYMPATNLQEVLDVFSRTKWFCKDNLNPTVKGQKKCYFSSFDIFTTTYCIVLKNFFGNQQYPQVFLGKISDIRFYLIVIICLSFKFLVFWFVQKTTIWGKKSQLSKERACSDSNIQDFGTSWTLSQFSIHSLYISDVFSDLYNFESVAFFVIFGDF